MYSDRDLERRQADNNCCLIYVLFLFGLIIGLVVGYFFGFAIGSDKRGGRIHEHSLNFYTQIFIVPTILILKNAAT